MNVSFHILTYTPTTSIYTGSQECYQLNYSGTIYTTYIYTIYTTKDISSANDNNMFTADSICEMIEFLIDKIFVQFGGRLFHQVIGIPMGTNCAPLLADLFLYSYENEFLDNMIRSGHRRLARSFNLCYRYIDDLIVFNNKKFLDYLKEIYPSRLPHCKFSIPFQQHTIWPFLWCVHFAAHKICTMLLTL